MNPRVKSYLLLFIIEFLYFIVLDVIYRTYISEIFEYNGFLRIDGYSNTGFKLLLALSSIASLAMVLRRYIFFYQSIFLNLVIFPFIVFSSYNDVSLYFQTLPVLYMLLSCITIVTLKVDSLIQILSNIRYLKQIAHFALLLISFMTAVIYLINIKDIELSIDLTQVYEAREKAEKLFSFGIFSYTNQYFYKVVSVYLLAHAIQARKIISQLCLTIMFLFLYAVSSYKAIVFFPLFIYIYYYCSGRQIAMQLIVPLVLIFACSLVYFLQNFDWGIFYGSIVVRRGIFVPAWLTANYFNFFDVNPFVFWTNGLFSIFGNSVYDEPVQLIIGRYIGTESFANNSFVSTGYMHSGLLGVIFYSFVFGLILKCIDSICVKNPEKSFIIVAVNMIPILLVITSTDLITAFLSHGLLLSLFLSIANSPKKSKTILKF